MSLMDVVATDGVDAVVHVERRLLVWRVLGWLAGWPRHVRVTHNHGVGRVDRGWHRGKRARHGLVLVGRCENGAPAAGEREVGARGSSDDDGGLLRRYGCSGYIYATGEGEVWRRRRRMYSWWFGCAYGDAGGVSCGDNVVQMRPRRGGVALVGKATLAARGLCTIKGTINNGLKGTGLDESGASRGRRPEAGRMQRAGSASRRVGLASCSCRLHVGPSPRHRLSSPPRAHAPAISIISLYNLKHYLTTWACCPASCPKRGFHALQSQSAFVAAESARRLPLPVEPSYDRANP